MAGELARMIRPKMMNIWLQILEDGEPFSELINAQKRVSSI